MRVSSVARTIGLLNLPNATVVFAFETTKPPFCNPINARNKPIPTVMDSF